MIGLSSDEDNKRIVSVNIIDAVTLNDLVYAYIDDGTGLEPSSTGTGQETILSASTGGETFFQLGAFPLVKAEVISQNQSPFAIVSGDTLTVAVNGIEETVIFSSSDFAINGSATAYEIIGAINARTQLIEARTTDKGTRIVLRAIANINESIQITGGTANTVGKLNFSTGKSYTTSLYRSNINEITLLSKDGVTASVENSTTGPYNFGSGGQTLTIVVDGKTGNTQSMTFQTSDFQFATSAKPSEIATAINNKIVGVTAYTSSNGTKITIASKTLNSSLSKIQVTGGTANTILNFPTSTVTGQNNDYSLNRFNGQIELNSPSSAGYKYEVGSFNTRAFITSTNTEPYNLSNGQNIVVVLDNGSSQTITFSTAQFAVINSATAQEVVDSINLQIVGGTAYKNSNNTVSIKTNTHDTTGSIKINSASATALGFTIGTTISNLPSHMAYLVGNNAAPYSFGAGNTLVLVIDDDVINNKFTIPFSLQGTVNIGSVGPFNNFIANITSLGQNFNTKFTKNNELVGYKMTWVSGLNNGQVSNIASYNNATGTMISTTAFTNAIVNGDKFIILPVTADNVARYLNNSVTSSLYTVATADAVSNGTKVQITSNTIGSAGSVQALLIEGNGAFNTLGLSNTVASGRDGYRSYTGIVKKAQEIVDGLDTDFDTFPGVRAAGVQIEILPPIVKYVSIKVQLALKAESLLLILKDKAVDVISSYVNSLGVGEDVVLSKITELLMEIDGILDVSFISPTVNIPIADNEIARSLAGSITIATGF